MNSCSFLAHEFGSFLLVVSSSYPYLEISSGSSVLKQDLTRVVCLFRFPICIKWYQSYAYCPTMAGEDDGLSGLFSIMGTAARRGNTFTRISLKVDDQNLIDGTYRSGHDRQSYHWCRKRNTTNNNPKPLTCRQPSFRLSTSFSQETGDFRLSRAPTSDLSTGFSPKWEFCSFHL